MQQMFQAYAWKVWTYAHKHRYITSVYDKHSMLNIYTVLYDFTCPIVNVEDIYSYDSELCGAKEEVMEVYCRQ